MKVYVFTHHATCNCEYLGTENKVFLNKKDALKALKEWRDDELVYVKRDKWIIETDTKEHFEAYEENAYSVNHTEGFVNEYEVIE